MQGVIGSIPIVSTIQNKRDTYLGVPFVLVLTSKVETIGIEGDRAKMKALAHIVGKNAMLWRF